ncbi:MAG: hypothetical protein ACREQ7_23275 [Candidatus Binatia bacterium]
MERKKAKNFMLVAILIVFMGFVGGCHVQSFDGHRRYDRRNDYYRDGWRDRRTYERRRDDWRDGRYHSRGDYDRNRWRW